MIKTIRDWFIEELNADDAIKAINNTINEAGEIILSYKKNTLAAALSSAFTWVNSPEGYLYWETLLSMNDGKYNNGTINIIEDSLDKLINKL